MFAWAEHDTASVLQQRAADLPAPQQRVLECEPLFCLEVAIKLLYFAGMAYEHDEVGRAALRCPTLPCTGTCSTQNIMCCYACTSDTLHRRPAVGFSTGSAQLGSVALSSQHNMKICTMLHGAPQCSLTYWRPAFVLQRHKPI